MGTVSIRTLAQSPSTTNMKFLVLFACVVAAASAQLVAYPNGAVAPAKTPEVQAAEAAHLPPKDFHGEHMELMVWDILVMLDIWDTVLDMLDIWDMLQDTDMMDTQDMPVTDMQDTHGVSLPTPTVP